MIPLADAAPSAADPMRWVEAGSRAFHEGGWAVLLGGAVMLIIYWWIRYGRRKGGD